MQFDVYQNKNAETRRRFPFLLDVQANILNTLQTRVVVPLAPRDLYEQKAVTRLMPVLEIQDRKYVAVVPQLAGVPSRTLGNAISNVAHSRQEIIDALDLLTTGV